MSQILGLPGLAFWGAIELGLIWALVGMAIFVSFRVLDFPDLTVDGTFPLGAAMTAWMIGSGGNPWVATLLAFLAGGLGGLVTAGLNVWGKIEHLLASILTAMALYSINIWILGGRPNVPVPRAKTIMAPFTRLGDTQGVAIVVTLLILAVVVAALVWFLASNFGLGMRATGANPKMARAQGVRTRLNVFVGLALANGLVALAGALFAQTNNYADVTSGAGTIVVGLAALILGEALFPIRRIWGALIGCIVGSVIYRFALQEALQINLFPSYDLKLVTALLVTAALILPQFLPTFRRSRP